MRLCVISVTVVAAILWVMAFILIGTLNILFPPYGGELLRVLASVYPHYMASGEVSDLLVGAFWAFWDGAIFGLMISVLYNAFAGNGDRRRE